MPSNSMLDASPAEQPGSLASSISQGPVILTEPPPTRATESVTTAENGQGNAAHSSLQESDQTQKKSNPDPNDANVDSGKSSAKDDSAEDDLDENYHYLNTVIRASIRHPSNDAYLDEERRNGRLGVRARQALLHHSLTHIRIEQLEKELNELKALVHNKKDGWEDHDGNLKFPIHLHSLRRSIGSNFNLSNESVKIPVGQQPALEVALGSTTAKKSLDVPVGDDKPIGTRLTTPERLRMRSRPLLFHLDLVLGLNLLRTTDETTIGPEEIRVFSATTFLRPFKLFVLKEAEIRQSLVELDKKMAEKPDQNSTTPASAASKRVRGETNDDSQRFDNTDLRQDLALLIEFLDTDLRGTFELRDKIRAGIDTEIEYPDLWHLFERGDLLVSRHNPDHAFRLLNYTGGREPLSHGPFYEEKLRAARSVDGFALDCYSLTSNGTSYVPIMEHFSIREFCGSQKITSLPVYPLKFHPQADLLRRQMMDGGRQFVDITNQPFCHMVAKGRTMDEPPQELDTQVIVDMVLALNANPDWRPALDMSQNQFTQSDPRETRADSYCDHGTTHSTCCGGDFIHTDLKLDEEDESVFLMRMGGGLFRPLSAAEVTEEHLMLMRPYVHAFVLRSRQWATLKVSDLGPVVFESTFHNLRIPDDHKTVVQALVKTHEAGKKGDAAETQSIGAAMDIVKGKGRGLIILLHGAPGVGKTSTAECVADDTKRPLYPITCGDIGETAIDVESNLHKSFQLAQKWGCVLLLDEADVFLTKRTKSDLRHNAVTSVFLRSLEYYSGILFLTTNRVGVMDLAFKSRIQMTLFYPKLDLDVTLKLYEMFLNRAKKEQEQRNSYRFRIKDKEILRFAKKHYTQLERDGLDTWNGRQIRNAFQTAIALAEYESTVAGPDEARPTLGKKQFESVAMGARKFDEYLTSTTGKTESDAARTDAWRDDRFMVTAGQPAPPPPPTRAMTAQYPAPRGLRHSRPAARDDTESETQSDDDDSDDDTDEEEEEERARRARKGKAVVAKTSKGRTKEVDAPASEADPAEQYKKFLEWQKSQQA